MQTQILEEVKSVIPQQFIKQLMIFLKRRNGHYKGNRKRTRNGSFFHGDVMIVLYENNKHFKLDIYIKYILRYNFIYGRIAVKYGMDMGLPGKSSQEVNI